MRIAVAVLAGAALLIAAWMGRYDISGQVSFGNSEARPVILDRWTGKTYVYAIHPKELKALGAWTETGDSTCAICN
jgi:hypothetical protein